MTYIGLLFIAGFIFIFYIGALLIFTPYEEDDKYVLKILESGYKLHQKAVNKKGILRVIIDILAKLVLILVYFILKDRKYTESIETKEDEGVN